MTEKNYSDAPKTVDVELATEKYSDYNFKRIV